MSHITYVYHQLTAEVYYTQECVGKTGTSKHSFLLTQLTYLPLEYFNEIFIK